MAETAAWLITGGGGQAARRHTGCGDVSSSNYAEFAYKLIKTTQELLQETDSGNDVKFFHLTTKNKNGAFQQVFVRKKK